MSNTKRTENREVREIAELTDDDLAVVVGGRTKEQRAKDQFAAYLAAQKANPQLWL